MRDLPYVGVVLEHQVKPNDYWNLLSKIKAGAVLPFNPFGFSTNFNYANTPSSFGYSLSGRTYSFNCSRGRTYELGRLEAGEASFQVDNSDGLFDPNNTASPLYGNVEPYRPIQIMAAYTTLANRTDSTNVVSGNILNDTNSVNTLQPFNTASIADYNAYRIRVGAKDSTFEGTAPYNWYCASRTPYSSASIVTSQSYSGTSSLQFGYNVYTQSNAALQVPVVAGKQITISYYYKNTGAATATHVCKVYDSPLIDWRSPVNSPIVSSAKGNTSSWLRNTLTLTPNTNLITISMEMQNTTNIVNDFTYIDDVMIEFGSTASATVVQTGPTLYPLWTGHVERYPSTYQAPNRGEANLVATDVFASLSQISMESLYESFCNSQATVYGSAACYYYYPMSEPSTATSASNRTSYSQNPLIPTTFGNFGLNPFFGGSTNTTDLIGMGGTSVATFYNVGLFNAGNAPYGTYLGVKNVTDLALNYNVNVSFWVYLSDNPTDIPNSTLFAFGDRSNTNWLSWRIGTGGILSLDWVKNGNATNVATGTYDYGAWNFISMSFDTAGQVQAASVSSTRGAGSTTNLSVTTVSPLFLNPSQMIIGAASNFATQGLGHLAVFQNAASPTASLFNLGKYGQITSSTTAESTGTRIKNILFNITNFVFTPFILDNGQSQMQAINPSGQSVADYIQSVSDTEGGSWYVDSSGYIVVQDRLDRQQNFSPSLVFGDNVGAGEIPYNAAGLAIDYDPQFVYNEVEIARNGGSTFVLRDFNSIKKYFRRTFNRTIYNTSDSEARDSGYWLLSRSKDPHPRPIQITLTPSSNTAIWATALGIEIDTLITVRLKPLNPVATQISINCFVEKVEHNFDAQSGDWNTVLTITPAVTTYWNAAAFRHTTNAINAAGFTFAKSASDVSQVNRYLLNNGVSLVFQYTNDGVTYLRCVTDPSSYSETSTSCSVNAYQVPRIINGKQSTNALVSLLSPSATGATATTNTTVSSTSGYYWIDGEIVTGTAASTNSVNITARAQLGTISAPHAAGSFIYPMNSAVSSVNGTVVTDWYPDVPLANLNYTTPPNTIYDSVSTIGQWATTTASVPTNTTSATPYVVNGLLSISPDNFNPSIADLYIGQILSFVGSNGAVENFAVISLPVPNTSGYLSLTGFKVTDSGLSLNASATATQNTLNITGTPPASGTVILIGNEFMIVTGGATGSWSVTKRGMAVDGTVLGVSNHNAYDKVYYVSNTGFTGTYVKGGAVYEGFNVSAPISGTTRLGY